MITFGNSQRNLPALMRLLFTLSTTIFVTFNFTLLNHQAAGEGSFPYIQGEHVYADLDPLGRIDIVWSAYNSSSGREDIFYVKAYAGEFLIDPFIIFRGGLRPTCLPFNDTITYISFWSNTSEGYYPVLMVVKYTRERITFNHIPLNLTTTPVKTPGLIRIRMARGVLFIFYSWGSGNRSGISYTVSGSGASHLLINTSHEGVAFDVDYDSKGYWYLSWWDVINNVSGVYLRIYEGSFQPASQILRKSVVNRWSWIGIRLSRDRINILFTGERSGGVDLIYTSTDLHGKDIIDDVVIYSAKEHLRFYISPPGDTDTEHILFTATSSGLKDVRMKTFILPTNFSFNTTPERVRENITELGETLQTGFSVNYPTCIPLHSRGETILLYPAPQPVNLPQMVKCEELARGSGTLHPGPDINNTLYTTGEWLNLSFTIAMAKPLPPKISVEFSMRGDNYNRTELIWFESKEGEVRLSWSNHLEKPGRATLLVVLDPSKMLPSWMKQKSMWSGEVSILEERLNILPETDYITLKAGDNRNISLTAENIGWGDARFAVSANIGGLRCPWVSTSPDNNLTLSTGEWISLRLNLTPTPTVPPGEYNLTIKADSLISGRTIGVAYVRVRVLRTVKVDLVLPEHLTIYPSKENRITVRMENLGNVEMEFSITGSLLNLAGNVIFGGKSGPLSKQLGVGDTSTFGVSIVLTKNPPAESEGQLILQCGSSDGDFQKEYRVNITVGEVITAEVDLQWEEYIYHPDVERNITGHIQIKNTGNVNLAVKPLFSQLPSGWSVTFHPGNLSIPLQESREVGFVLEFNEIPMFGEYVLTLELYEDSSEKSILQKSVKVVVEKFENITVDIIMGERSVLCNRTPFNYRWIVNTLNSGNTPVTVQVFTGGELYRHATILVNGISYNWTSSPEFTLNPGEGQELTIEISITKKPATGVLQLTFYLKNEGGSPKTLNLVVEEPSPSKSNSTALVLSAIFITTGIGGIGYYLYRRGGLSSRKSRQEEEEEVL